MDLVGPGVDDRSPPFFYLILTCTRQVGFHRGGAVRSVKILERILASIPLMLGIAIIVFMLMRIMPGDPVDIMIGESGNTSQKEMEALRQDLGLDRPLLSQLGSFLGGLVHGDLGVSFQQQRPVSQVILETFPATIELALVALFFAVIIALPIGVMSAVRQNSLLDRLSMAGSFLGISMPAFWLGLVLIVIFAVFLQWLPTSGRLNPNINLERITGLNLVDGLLTGNWAAFKDSFLHLILPGFTLGAEMMAIIARVSRSSMLEILRQDYVTLARAKGVADGAVVVKHALRNALIPTVTVVGLQVGVLLGGNMIVETVFAWPGLGRLVVGAIYSRDYAVVQGAVMLYALTFVLASLIVDIVYTYANPKISL